MQRVISLFREADDGYPTQDFDQTPAQMQQGEAADQAQPLYFVELLNYLRDQGSPDLEPVAQGAD